MLDLDAIYRETCQKEFSAAKEIYYNNDVVKISDRKSDGKTLISAKVKDGGVHDCEMIFDEQGGLYDYNCDCGNADMTGGPCRHITAAALYYEEKNNLDIVAAKPVRASDGMVASAIRNFGRAKKSRITGTEISLVPTLLLGEPALTFGIGLRRIYKLKDLDDFAAAMDSLGYRRYGTELAFYHTSDNFDERSKELCKMICREKSARNKNIFRLSPYAFDRFCEIFSGTSVKTEKDGAAEGTKKISSVPPSFTVTANKVKEGVTFSSDVKGRIFHGGKQDYLFTESAIYPLDEKALRIAALFAGNDFFVADCDMPSFYNSVLAEIKDDVRIVSDIELNEFAAPALSARLYLDFDGKAVEGSLDIRYGDIETELGGEDVEWRDYEGEAELKELLAMVFPDYPSLRVEKEEDIYLLVKDGLARLYGRAEIFLSEAFKGLKTVRLPKIKIGIKPESGILKLSYSAEGMDRESLEKILAGIKKGKKYIRLGDEFVDLAEASKSLYGILNLPQTGGGVAAYYSKFLYNEIKENDLGDFSAAKTPVLSDSLPPAGLVEKMRAYQITGFKWLKALTDNGYGGILADDMGLGKSIQTIALIADIAEHDDKPSLIVCPTTLILNWVQEFGKFAPHIPVRPVIGSYSDRPEILRSARRGEVLVTSYDLLRRDAAMYNMRFALIVVDEAQYIKNPLTKNAEAVKSLSADRRIALTGTPIENNLSELWSIFDFLMPGYLFDYETFRETIETAVIREDVEAEDRLRRMITPFVLRRMKSDVLKELPPKMETVLSAPLCGEQKLFYDAHLSLLKENFDKNANKITVLALLTKLRQICCDPRLVDDGYAGNSEKLDLLLEILSGAVSSGHKVLVFSQFTSMLDIIADRLNAAGYTFYVLKGDTPKAERLRLINKFNSDGTQVFLLSLKAGGTGVNLIGADVVIHYDPWWNNSVMNQATDRSYRIGQEKSVHVYKLTMDGSVENKIMELQKNKDKLGERFTGSDLAYDKIIEYLKSAST